MKNGNKNLNLLTIVIPVYNEKSFIVDILARVYAADSLGLVKEIIVVDDASTDGTSPVLVGLQKKHRFTYLKNEKNSGKGATVKKGFLKAKGDIVLVQDADLEYNPADYPTLLEPFFQNDADVVYGSRFISNRPHRILYFWHYFANLILTMLSNMLSNLNLTDMETGYKLFRKNVVLKIAPRLQSKRFGFEPEVTARIGKIKGLKIYEVGISYSGRTYEEGKKIGWKDGLRAIFEILYYNLFSR